MKKALKNVALMISIPKAHRDLLKRIVAERMVNHPDETVNVTSVCREAITIFLDNQHPEIKLNDQKRSD